MGVHGMSEKKILVVSEDQALRKKIIEFLVIVSTEYIGFGVATMAEIDQHLANADNGPLAALLTDYKFQTFNGFDVIKKVSKITPNVTIILMPELNQVLEFQAQIIANPVHDIMCKPLNMKYLELALKIGLKLA
jgi:DNA-binding NtrC family response regulator